VAIDFELALFLTLAVLTGAIGLRHMWISHRSPTPHSPKHAAVDPIISPKLRIKVYDSGAPFIPMPNHLKTRDEMVAWMAKELPKLTAEIAAHPNEKPRG
jgi:hypothetical protein